MLGYLDGKVVAKLPDVMAIGDTVVMENGIFEIVTKTIDLTTKEPEIYCNMQLYNEPGHLASDVFEDIYESSVFTTSGPNTNEIEENPRIIILFIIASVIIDGENLKNMAPLYRRNVILSWSNVDIPWSDIFTDNPLAVKSADQAIPIIRNLLESSKIAKNMWPSALQSD